MVLGVREGKSGEGDFFFWKIIELENKVKVCDGRVSEEFLGYLFLLGFLAFF